MWWGMFEPHEFSYYDYDYDYDYHYFVTYTNARLPQDEKKTGS